MPDIVPGYCCCIVVCALFFSDVLRGGTFSFLSVMLFREIFILKGANLKAVFAKSKD